MKRLLDLGLVLITLPLWMPIFIMVAFLVRVNLGKPIFFKQLRLGLNNQPFDMIKFRTMQLGDGSDAQRLTRIGSILRSCSLDELPELWLVIKGTMSLVGPRPLPTRYLPRYSPEQLRRHNVLPGITGWAQIHGRNMLTWQDKFQYDVWYVDHHTVGLDIRILWLTIWKVLKREGISAENEATMGEFKG